MTFKIATEEAVWFGVFCINYLLQGVIANLLNVGIFSPEEKNVMMSLEPFIKNLIFVF